MAYKFQFGDAVKSGSLTQEGNLIVTTGGDSSKGVISGSNFVDILDGKLRLSEVAVTANATELNLLDGVTATTAEINYLDGASANLATFTVPASTTISTYGATLVDDANAGAARTTLGLGNVATLDVGISENNVAQFDATPADDDFLRINGTKVEGRSASEVLADIGAQPLDAQLTDIAGLTPSDSVFIVGDGANFVAESGATARTSLGLGTAAVEAVGVSENNVAQFQAGVADDDFLRINGSKVEGRSASEVLADIGAQPLDAQLTDIAGLTPSNGVFIVGDGANFVAETADTAIASLGISATGAELSKLAGYASGSFAATDELLFADADDSDKIKSVQRDVFLRAIAGAGLSVSGNKLVSDASTAVAVIGNIDALLVEGMNAGSTAFTGSGDAGRINWRVPQSTTMAVGDIIRVKAPSSVGNTYLNVTASGADSIDGQSSIRLESGGAAVSLMMIGNRQYIIF